MNSQTARTGLDLKLARVARRVKQKALGAAMGVSDSRISAIEREGFVTPQLAERYLKALDTCDTSTPSAAA